MKLYAKGLSLAVLTMFCTATMADQPRTNEKRPDQDRNQTRQETKQEDRNQTRKDDRRPGQQRAERGDRFNPQQQLQQYYAAKLMLMNQSTVRVSKMAAEKTQTKEVREFAQMLAEGHTDLNQQLAELSPAAVKMAELQKAVRHQAGYRGVQTNKENSEAGETEANSKAGNTSEEATTENSAEANPEPKPEQTPKEKGELWNINENTEEPDEEAAERGNQTQGSRNLLVRRIFEVDQQASENHLEAMNRMLNRYEGQDFDMAYLGFQIGSHTWALSELTALEKMNLGDQKFQKLVKQSKQNVEKHLKEAKQLSRQFEDDEDRDSDNS